MLFTVNIDNDNYVLSVSHTANDNIDIDLTKIEVDYLNAYQLIDNVLVLNEERKAQIIAEREALIKQEEIDQLKEKLNETDYIMAETFESIMALNNPVTFISDFIKVLVDFKQQYAEALTNRKTWRQRIKELEG